MPETHLDALPPSDPALKSSQHELNTSSDGVALTEAHTEPIAPSRRLRLYVTALLLAPFACLAICIATLRSDFFVRHTRDLYLANIGYGMKLHNADCQVLLYGDSSAMIGLDPATIQRSTGLSTCNIAEFAGMTMVNGTVVLDTYLRHNPRPQYLVFLFAPENLAPYPTWKYAGTFEAVLFRLRQPFDLGLLRMTMLHPEEVLSAAETAARFALVWSLEKSFPPSTFHARELTRGRLEVPSVPIAACDPQKRMHPPDRAWIDGLRSRYSVGGTKVLVDVTPLPTCDPDLNTYAELYAPDKGLTDNQLHTYPVQWYTKSARLHLTTQGIPVLSNEIASQINQLRLTGATRENR